MSVKAFFDESSRTYDSKYSRSKNRYLEHYFRERLTKATGELALGHKVIWDIGAGTGQLYRHLTAIAEIADYQAVDISDGMLSKSPIPPERRTVGTFTDVAPMVPDSSVDYFFMLGVTTYMSDDEIADTFKVMQSKAALGSLLIVTITNRASLERFLQQAASFVLSLPGLKRVFRSETRVAGQGFMRNIMTLNHFQNLLPKGAHIVSVTALNQTFTPFNRIMPRLSIILERWIQVVTKPDSQARRFLSSDLLLRVRLSR